MCLLRGIEPSTTFRAGVVLWEIIMDTSSDVGQASTGIRRSLTTFYECDEQWLTGL